MPKTTTANPVEADAALPPAVAERTAEIDAMIERTAKVHLIPKGTAAALCGAKRDGGRLAVSTAAEFGKLGTAERCGRCQTIVAGKPRKTDRIEAAKKTAAKPARKPAKQGKAKTAAKTAPAKKRGSTAARAVRKPAGDKPESVRETIWRLIQRKEGCNEREVCEELGGWKKAGATISRAIKAAPFKVRKERGADGRTRYFGAGK